MHYIAASVVLDLLEMIDGPTDEALKEANQDFIRWPKASRRPLQALTG
ncbi:hypothetical protein AM1_B0308 (plasmid) [Acaryochloris marina MBIC11017]|uniref:Uncharacterized protein n=1 Tax=Acaryochloris marina (strain MBIC 11017) TaxID=329726 RepID=A8ZLK0_ACAM1|nr:hypothetical protein AM1_B0308 [Acaryochloris marina MBIC11017]